MKFGLPKDCKLDGGKIVCVFDGFRQNYRIDPQKPYLFEYHCLESEESCDAKLWHHTHQKVKLLAMVEPGAGKTERERADGGESAYFRARFDDGFEGDVGEDELMSSKRQFYQPEYVNEERLK